MEACLKHLQSFDKSLCKLANSEAKVHRRVDKRAKETEELKGRVLELETRNVLLEAKVRDSAMVNLTPPLSFLLGRFLGNHGSPNAG